LGRELFFRGGGDPGAVGGVCDRGRCRGGGRDGGVDGSDRIWERRRADRRGAGFFGAPRKGGMRGVGGASGCDRDSESAAGGGGGIVGGRSGAAADRGGDSGGATRYRAGRVAERGRVGDDGDLVYQRVLFGAGGDGAAEIDGTGAEAVGPGARERRGAGAAGGVVSG